MFKKIWNWGKENPIKATLLGALVVGVAVGAIVATGGLAAIPIVGGAVTPLLAGAAIPSLTPVLSASLVGGLVAAGAVFVGTPVVKSLAGGIKGFFKGAFNGLKNSFTSKKEVGFTYGSLEELAISNLTKDLESEKAKSNALSNALGEVNTDGFRQVNTLLTDVIEKISDLDSKLSQAPQARPRPRPPQGRPPLPQDRPPIGSFTQRESSVKNNAREEPPGVGV